MTAGRHAYDLIVDAPYWPHPNRAALIADLVQLYESGETVRGITESRRISYGSVRNLLAEGGVQMRSRGYRRSSTPPTPPSP
ncbi:helix-turn-helix domain-containing protein [Streptomyces microflavus]|uniref:helix-turn-helix domain-containing protein n=1 Tax=Streptomyces microflavus TaxID=1919 RepID=UPI003657E176